MSTNESLRILVVDDHPLFLEGVVSSLQSADDIDVVWRASEANEAVCLARENLPDVALLDLNIPGSGLEAGRRIAETCPSTKIVILTASDDEDSLMAAMKAGASGYVLKGVSARELIGVVRTVSQGEVYVSPSIAGRLVRDLSKPRPCSPLDELSTREREVLELLATGLSNQEIGDRLCLAEKTVKHYMTSVLNKLHVRSRIEAALLAHKAGLGSNPK